MKKIAFVFLSVLVVSCGSKTNKSNGNDQDSTQTNNDSTEAVAVDLSAYSINYNNQQYENYGRICAQPFDTCYFADSVMFSYNGNLIYTETTEEAYIFCKNINFWPKLVSLKSGEALYILEHNLEEPNCPDFYGFIFSGDKFVKRVEMKQYEFWKIDMEKNYTEDELMKMIGDNAL